MIGPIQALKGLRAVARITMDPTNLDEVFVLADLSGASEKLHEIVTELKNDPVFGRVMIEKPRLGVVDQEVLGGLEDGTFGRAYAEFMQERGLRHENLILVKGDSDMDFLRNHLRETHDLWHVVTGFDTDVAGELGLQAFYISQLRGPLPVLLITIGLLNTLVRGLDEVEDRMNSIARGWILGRRARPLFGMRWSERWSDSIKALRAELNIDLDDVDSFLARRGPDEPLFAAA